MAEVIISGGGGGGVSSDELSAVLANVLAGKTVVASDTNDEIGTGTLPLSAVLVANGGTIATYDGSVS